MAIIDGKKYTTESAGKLIEQLAADGGQPIGVILGPDASQALTSCTYSINGSVPLEAKFGEELAGTLSGSVSLAVLDVGGQAMAALPTDANLSATFQGQTVKFTLEKSSPFNSLRANVQGEGTLGLVMKVDSKSPMLAASMYMGQTMYFEVPVTVAPDWQSFTVAVASTRSGRLLTPVDDDVLLAADGRFEPRVTNTPCADDNNNGIRDGAEEQINAIDSQLDCGQ